MLYELVAGHGGTVNVAKLSCVGSNAVTARARNERLMFRFASLVLASILIGIAPPDGGHAAAVGLDELVARAKREGSVSFYAPTTLTSARAVFIAGNTASDPTGNVAGLADVRAQTRYILEKIKMGVEAAGGTLQDIVSMNVFTTDARYHSAVNEVRREFLGSDFPASTMVQVVALARPELLLEINAVAIVPESAVEDS